MRALKLLLAARAAGVGLRLVDGAVMLSGPAELRSVWLAKLRPHRKALAAWLATEQAIERARAATTTPRAP